MANLFAPPDDFVFLSVDGRGYVAPWTGFTVLAICRELWVEALGNATRPIFGLLWDVQ